jgi:hypothetical protein
MSLEVVEARASSHVPSLLVSFDPSTNKEQRDALAPMILKTYGLEWGELKVQEAPIEISHSGDIVNASLRWSNGVDETEARRRRRRQRRRIEERQVFRSAEQ